MLARSLTRRIRRYERRRLWQRLGILAGMSMVKEVGVLKECAAAIAFVAFLL